MSQSFIFMAQPALVENESLTREVTLEDIGTFTGYTGDPTLIHKEVVEPHKAVVVPGLFLASHFLLHQRPEGEHAFRFRFVKFAYPGTISVHFDSVKNKYIIENFARITGETYDCVDVIPLDYAEPLEVRAGREAEFSISPTDFEDRLKPFNKLFTKNLSTAKSVYPFVAALFPGYFVNHSDLGGEINEKKVSVAIKGIELRVYAPLVEIPRSVELTYYKPKWTMGIPKVLLEARLPDNTPNNLPFMSVALSLPSKD